MRRTGVLLGCLALAACSDAAPTLSAADYAEAPGPSKVVYQVTGTLPEWMPWHLQRTKRMSASVTVTTPTGTQQGDVQLPMRNDAGGRGLHFDFSAGEFVYIAAQNDGEWGSVTCRILVNGEVVSENTSTGSYGIATCKGSA